MEKSSSDTKNYPYYLHVLCVYLFTAKNKANFESADVLV